MNGPSDTSEFRSDLQDAWALFQSENWESAREAFRKLCKHHTDSALLADAWYGKSAALLKLGDVQEANLSLKYAHELSPNNPIICTAYAKFLLNPASLNEAISVLSKGLQDSPSDSNLLRLAADAYDMANDINGAIRVCESLSRLEPQNPLVHLKLGRLRMIRGELDISLKHYRIVLSVDPNHVIALDGLSDVLRIQGPVLEARNVLLKRAELSSTSQEKSSFRLKAALTHPVISKGVNEINEARETLAQTLAAGPEAAFEDPWKLGLGPCFYMGYQGRNDRALHEALAEYYLKATPSLSDRASHVNRPVSPTCRLRVGIVSNFFSKHTIGYLSYGLIAGLDRQQFDVQLFQTPRAIPDPQTSRFLAAAPCIQLPPDLQAAREIISDKNLDILHYPEIGMDHFTYFLAFARLATVQTVTWGHPITTGLPNIDLFLSVDTMEPPQAESHYCEKLVRLNTLSINVEQPSDIELDPANTFLEPNRPSYLCAQSLYKIHAEFDSTIARILDLDQDGLLYFISLGLNADAELTTRLAQTLGTNIGRVRFLPRVTPSRFLQIVKQADVALDIPHWSGGKTSLDAFAMGTPVVHQPGKFMRGRHTTAFYGKMGFNDAIAHDSESYAVTAAALVHDSKFKQHVRAQIAENRGKLFSDESAIREIESVWIAAVRERA